jgi:hypothetical protein
MLRQNGFMGFIANFYRKLIINIKNDESAWRFTGHGRMWLCGVGFGKMSL